MPPVDRTAALQAMPRTEGVTSDGKRYVEVALLNFGLATDTIDISKLGLGELERFEQYTPASGKSITLNAPLSGFVRFVGK